MSVPPPVTYSKAADGVGWIVFDDPASRANVFTAAVQDALEGALDAAIRDGVKAVVMISGKERVFIAGADLEALARLPDMAAATEFSRRGQGLFQRVAEFPVPIVCAIHGACAGGGFELALACHWRIASDSPFTRLGLPETSLGTIPGWGGSVRLPRLIGVKLALDHILAAQLVNPGVALEGGLVHEVVPPAELTPRAAAAAARLAAEGHPVRLPAAALPRDAIAQVRARAQARTRGPQPALLAAIDAVEESADLPIPAALEIEARHFGEVTPTDTCRNLIHVFRLREAARKRTVEGWFESEGRATATLPSIDRVGVVGAGVMGSGIAQWLAARGLEVVLRDVNPGYLARGLDVVHGLFDEAVARGKLTAGEANSALHRIATTTGWEGFEDCDLVIEAIVESTGAKQALFSELGGVVRPDAILASNTSALPIDEIAGHVPHPGRALGIHFFNPVSRMELVELVIGKHTSGETAERILALVKALGKSPVLCRSSPGFLVTRVLFVYLHAALQRWEEGEPAEALDAALRDFGWPMGPLRLIDEVGIDITDAIFAEMAHYFPGRFTRKETCARLLAGGLKGRKHGTSRGFYRYEDGKAVPNEPETRSLVQVRARSEQPPRADAVAELMRIMVDEAQRCLDEGVVKSEDDVDFALISGAGFPPFRGGLMRWARAGRNEGSV